ncbi:MAG: cell division protein FtsW [Proteobacteria bacterium]|nr:cell division protein FtsW [Pseudomonadota bacterium]
MRFLSAEDRSFLSRWWWSLDHALLAAMLALAVIGIGLVMSAGPAVASRIGADTMHFTVRQAGYLVLALGAMCVCSMLSSKQIWRLATFAGMAAILGVILTLFVGQEIKGATRWITVFGLSIQPSEFVKPLVTVLLGWLLARQKTTEGFPGFIIAMGLCLFVVSLLVMQPDYGMTFVFLSTFVAMIVLAGCPLRYIAVFGVFFAVLFTLAYFTVDHVHSRVERFLDPSKGDTYQVDRSLEAFSSGGLFGTGPGGGQVKMQLPDAHADFIFSVAAEEMGFVFAVILICIYGFIILRGFARLRASNSVFAMLGGGGLLFMLGLQALIHMGSATQIIPAKGMTLPLISYGGSSLIAVGMTMGIILALTKGQGAKRHDFRWKPAAASEF